MRRRRTGLIQTIADIKMRLQNSNQEEFAVIARALRSDTRKGVVSALESARRRFEAEEAEKQRLHSLYNYEKEVSGGKLVLGLDEVGRGSVAGPLAVGAVVLPDNELIPGLDDSKKIAPHKRISIAKEIRDRASAWSICYIEAEEIDAAGISVCLRIAFMRTIAEIEAKGIIPEVILLDGYALSLDEREINIVKGDTCCASIAAASIIAKVDRDRHMEKLSVEYPAYGFDASKGYASSEHIAAIKTQGFCPQHRRSFCTSFLQESLF